ncbi:hypothetical protein Hanom_Chr17g01560591 [Helianthus anomalus]
MYQPGMEEQVVQGLGGRKQEDWVPDCLVRASIPTASPSSSMNSSLVGMPPVDEVGVGGFPFQGGGREEAEGSSGSAPEADWGTGVVAEEIFGQVPHLSVDKDGSKEEGQQSFFFNSRGKI